MTVTPEFELAAEDIAGQILEATDRSKKKVTRPEVRWDIDKYHENKQIDAMSNCFLDMEL